MIRRTEEEIVKVINDYMEKHPHVDSRNRIALATDISTKKMSDLELKGLVKLPPKIKTGSRTPWRLPRP